MRSNPWWGNHYIMSFVALMIVILSAIFFRWRQNKKLGTVSEMSNEDMEGRPKGKNDIVERFRQLASDRKMRPMSDEWLELYAYTNMNFPVLKKYGIDICRLSIEEYQICILIKLGFPLSDIGYLTNLSPSNLSNKRARLLKKLFAEDGGAKEFDDRIINL